MAASISKSFERGVADVHLGPIGARLEWESVEAELPDNLSMVSLSATFSF